MSSAGGGPSVITRDGAAVLGRELDRLRDRAPAVRVHLELEAVAHEPTVGAELHRLELRDLLDERGDREAHDGADPSGGSDVP